MVWGRKGNEDDHSHPGGNIPFPCIRLLDMVFGPHKNKDSLAEEDGGVEAGNVKEAISLHLKEEEVDTCDKVRLRVPQI